MSVNGCLACNSLCGVLFACPIVHDALMAWMPPREILGFPCCAYGVQPTTELNPSQIFVLRAGGGVSIRLTKGALLVELTFLRAKVQLILIFASGLIKIFVVFLKNRIQQA